MKHRVWAAAAGEEVRRAVRCDRHRGSQEGCAKRGSSHHANTEGQRVARSGRLTYTGVHLEIPDASFTTGGNGKTQCKQSLALKEVSKTRFWFLPNWTLIVRESQAVLPHELMAMSTKKEDVTKPISQVELKISKSRTPRESSDIL